MKTLMEYIRPNFPQMALGTSSKFIGTLMELYLPWVLAHIIDNIVPQKNISVVVFWGLIMIVSSVGALITNLFANRIAAEVSRKTTEKLRSDLFQKIFILSSSQVDHHSIPSLISRLTSDCYNVHRMIIMLQRMGIRAPILLIGSVIITLTLDVFLALVLICSLPLIGFLLYFVSRKGMPLYEKLQGSIDTLICVVRENIVGIRVIKALSKTEYEKNRFDIINKEVVARETKAGKVMATTAPLMSLMLNLGLISVIITGAYLVDIGITQTGKIIAFMTYFTIILTAILAVNRMVMMVTKGRASAARIAEVLSEPEDLLISPIDKIVTDYHVIFDAVSFSYLKTENNIKDISFKLKKGETLGIIGSTGSGKSTIVSLLMRLYDYDCGSIRIDGQTVSSIASRELHEKFGVVFQNDFLLADTITENITFGRGYSEEAIIKAAKFAQASKFIEQKNDGFSHVLTIKGMNLSGGEKQRVLLSRALYLKPEILILDDSSSALDYQTDADLRTAIKENFQASTTIIVAQRISSIMHADHILVLEAGETIGYGKHDDLLKSCQIYREISISQIGMLDVEGEQIG